MSKSTKPDARAFSRFLVALTAVDQIPEDERNRATVAQSRKARRGLKDDRYEAWMTARAAYHTAQAAETRACMARILHQEEVTDLNVAEKQAVHKLIKAANRFFMLPVLGAGDLKDRQTLMRQWGRACGNIYTSPLWQEAKQRWQAHLAGEA